MRPFLLLGAALLCAGCGGAAETPRQEVTVFAAASLADVLEALADSFETAHPDYDVRLNLAATSLLARQIEQGAPADVFFSASIEWMERTEALGKIRPPVLYPIGNALVVAGPAEADTLPDLRALPAFERIAVAEPSSVPAGIYAKEALTCLGLWEAVAPKLIPSLDVRTALLTVRNRAADAAVVYRSDLLAGAGVKQIGVIPEACQPEIRYAAALVTSAPHAAGGEAFLRYATAPEQGGVWETHGFRFVRDR